MIYSKKEHVVVDSLECYDMSMLERFQSCALAKSGTGAE